MYSSPRELPPLWRISNFGTLDGAGGRKFAGRWHSAGRPVVYLAESPAGALLETLVHLEMSTQGLPLGYHPLGVRVTRPLAVEEIHPPVAGEWKLDFASTRRLGDHWLAGVETALARVPSAMLPYTFNYLLNPAHPDARWAGIHHDAGIDFDPRLLHPQPR